MLSPASPPGVRSLASNPAVKDTLQSELAWQHDLTMETRFQRHSSISPEWNGSFSFFWALDVTWLVATVGLTLWLHHFEGCVSYACLLRRGVERVRMTYKASSLWGRYGVPNRAWLAKRSMEVSAASALSVPPTSRNLVPVAIPWTISSVRWSIEYMYINMHNIVKREGVTRVLSLRLYYH